MLLNYDFFQTMLLVLSYMLIYNLTSLLLFFTVTQVLSTNLKTLFSFSDFDSSNVFTKILSLVILSLAGVPPLLGFFSKIFVFVLITNSNFFVLFPPLFVLLFTGLYFYVQNLRFLNSTNAPTQSLPFALSTRASSIYFSLAIPLTFIVVFGFCYVDDLTLFSAWLLL